MRTMDEIAAKLAAPEADDMFGTFKGDLMEWLPFDRVKHLLKPEATEEKWKAAGFPRPLTDIAVLDKIKNYMPFAWQKANDCRGLSATRSILHMRAWMWLLGADEAVAATEHYSHYGKAHLAGICEAIGFDWREFDDGKWRNGESEAGEAPGTPTPITLPNAGAAS